MEEERRIRQQEKRVVRQLFLEHDQWCMCTACSKESNRDTYEIDVCGWSNKLLNLLRSEDTYEEWQLAEQELLEHEDFNNNPEDILRYLFDE